jgi:hypothetical protein
MTYVDDARSRIGRLAGELEQRGPEGLAEDLSRFARRRPGAFLLGAGLVGFAAGRVVRAGAATRSEATP